jgi:hypothetical protein
MTLGQNGAAEKGQGADCTRANPAKVEDFGDKDLLQDIDLARFLPGEVVPLRREASYATGACH